MTYHLVAKWFLLVMIIIFPLVLYSSWEIINHRRKNPKSMDGWRLFITVSAWICGFFFAQQSQMHHQIIWFKKYGHLPLTEELLSKMGDAPQITYTYILLGWIPIILASILTRHYFRRRKEPKISVAKSQNGNKLG